MAKKTRLTGALIQAAAVEVARQRGYICAHFTPATVREGRMVTPYAYDTKGFPDLLLVGRKVVAVEVKGDGDTLRPAQKDWLDAFERAGIETLVLTSAAWREGKLEEVLDR
jgi:hypothetical protein